MSAVDQLRRLTAEEKLCRHCYDPEGMKVTTALASKETNTRTTQWVLVTCSKCQAKGERHLVVFRRKKRKAL